MAASSLEAKHPELHLFIVQQNKDLAFIENMRLEEVNGVLVAIDLSSMDLKGENRAVYPAFPIDYTGKIHTEIELMAKIIKYDAIGEPPQKKNLNAGNIWIKATDPKIWLPIQSEAINDNVLFSSTAAQIEGGAIILMSKVPGVPLLNLIDKHLINTLTLQFKKLTIMQRIHLAIEAITALETLHEEDIFPRDIMAGNILIHLSTLSAMLIDLGHSDETELTKAPENSITAQSNIYSIALDILIPIFSGIRAKKDDAGKIKNIEKIKSKIKDNCYIDVPVRISELFAENIIPLLDKIYSEDPQDRGTLKKIREALEEMVIDLIEQPLLIDDNEQNKYQEQLRVLENKVLNKPLFKMALNKILESLESHPVAAAKPPKSNFGLVSYFRKRNSKNSLSTVTQSNFGFLPFLCKPKENSRSIPTETSTAYTNIL